MRRGLKALLMNARLRMTVFSVVVVYCAVLVGGWLIYGGVKESLINGIKAHVEMENKQLLGDYYDDGLEELRHDISERIEASKGQRYYYMLTNREGKSVFDNLPVISKQGWHTEGNINSENGLLMLVTKLDDGYWLTVASGSYVIAEVNQAIFDVIYKALLVVAVLSVAVSLVLSWRFMRRVVIFKNLAASIEEGNISARLPVRGSGDSFDQLSEIINHMLEKIQDLMHEVKYVSGSIAHDLRTPLTRLRNTLDSLQEAPNMEEVQSTRERALGNIDEILQIFSSILRIAEIESGNNSLQLVTINVNSLIDDLVDMYSPVAEDMGHSIRAMHHSQVQFEGDQQLITQALVNLIENAMKHNESGVEILVSAGSKDEAGVVVTVADNGKGIPAHEVANVLKPLYRLDSSRGSKGSGLGLSLVKGIIKRHGLKLSFEENNPGLRAVISKDL